jgi:hypothetical protein
MRDQLISQAEKAMDAFEPLLAAKFYERAFQLEHNAHCAELIGVCLLEGLNMENQNAESLLSQARAWFLESANLEPNEGHGKFLSLAQLSAGLEAVQFYERGLFILSNLINQTSDKAQLPLLKQQYSAALCSLTEIFLTDCW